MQQPKKVRVLTWHVHGAYLYYLSKTDCLFFVPVKKGRPEGYGGLPEGNFNWPENIHEVDADNVKELEFDCILFQSEKNYKHDQFEILTPKQRKLPKIYLEHDPPRVSPTDTVHFVKDKDVLLVHVTHFNNLMWENQVTTKVIEHGVDVLRHNFTGELRKGVVVVNNMSKRGRRLGLDIFEKVRKDVPLDIVGMGSEDVGGLGEIRHGQLIPFISKYRFFFNPIRYTSFGLSVCEAMVAGMPIISLSTTEMPSVIKDGVSGFVNNDIEELKKSMKLLLENRDYAQALGENARRDAIRRFNIQRFSEEWKETFISVTESEKKLQAVQTLKQYI